MGFFVFGMMGRFGYAEIFIITTIHWVGFLEL